MKCKICNRKTNWNESYGYEEFIVCPSCHNTLYYTMGKNSLKTMDIIFTLGKCARQAKETKNT